MKNIGVFKKSDEEFKYTLVRGFDKEEDLNLWLENTCENKDELFIMKQLKRRSE